MSTATLAVIGAVTGVIAALTGILQIIAHRKSGRVVSVESSYWIPIYGPPNRPEFHDDDQVAVIVYNRGGAPVTVTNYGVALGGKRSKKNLFVVDRPSWATGLPTSVEPGGEPAHLMVPIAQLRKVQEAHGIPFRKMRPWVDLGDHRRIYSRNAVPPLA